MSRQATDWAWRQNLPPIAKLVLLVIADCANELGENAYPGQDHIAVQVGVTDRCVRTWLKWLTWQGYISRQRRQRRDGSRTSDGYTLHLVGYRKDVPVGMNTYRKIVPGLPEPAFRAINQDSNLSSIEEVVVLGEWKARR